MAIKILDSKYAYHKVGDHVTAFQISNEDLAGDPQYFGYVNEEEAWIIQERNIANGTYKYVIGRGDYDTAVTGAWATRAAQTYVLYSDL